jgi:hypothetical protein
MLMFITSLIAMASVIAALGLIARLIFHIKRGVTKELKMLAFAFLLLTLAWLVAALDTLPAIHVGFLTLIFAPFGMAWYVQHGLLIIGIGLLLRWTWHYISLRLLPQFYLSVIAIGLTSFVVSTVVFTSVLFRTAEAQALRSIEADVKTFALVLRELTDRTSFVAAAIAARETLAAAVEANDPETSSGILGDPIADYDVAAAYVLNAGGELLATSGTESIIGQSFAHDPVAQRVLKGNITGSPLLEPGVETPTITIRSGSPLVRDGRVWGAVLVDTPLDTTFVDRMHAVTGLDVTVYAQQNRVATTVRDSDGRPLVPATMEDQMLADRTLNQGKVFSGRSTLASLPYFVAALPLTNVEEARIGALVAGLPAQQLIDALLHGTRMSFFIAFGLLVLALAPFFFLAKFLAKSAAGAR